MFNDRPDNPPSETSSGSPLAAFVVCVLLLAAVWLVFGQTLDHGFINLDDDTCLTQNPRVTDGLTLKSIGWAFTNRYVGNWDPLTWISHMADWQIYGEKAWGHHLTNVLLHAATAMLLFLVLRRMTGRFWPSALAAALFAVHPLRVESVAWVTERKDVLSGFFFMLTLAAYVGYVHHRRFSPVRYLAVIALFAMGLMSKPMLVTLPCVLLLLDFWPLRRLELRTPLWLVLVEKIPLFVLSAACCAITVWAQHVPEYQYHSAWWRIGGAAISYMDYLGRFFYPAGLAPLCPRMGFDLPPWPVVGSFFGLAAITAAVFVWPRKRPYLPVGWLWYLGMLFPVVGLVPFGTQATADRFTYLPQIGLCIALVWGADELCRTRPRLRLACGIASAAALIALTACSRHQTTFWRDSETLWSRTIACTSNNYMAHNALGKALAERGLIDEAESHFRRALEIWPDDPSAHFNLGVAATGRGRWTEAIAHYRRAIRANPRYTAAYNNLANAYLHVGDMSEAIANCRTALRIDPNFSEARINLGAALLSLERFSEAADEYRLALAGGNYAEAHYNLAIALYFLKRYDEAKEHYRAALRLQPDIVNGRLDLGELLPRP